MLKLLVGIIIPFNNAYVARINTKRSFQGSSCLKLASSLSTSKFVELMEEKMIDKFGKDESHRVIESVHFLERGYEHKEFVGNKLENGKKEYYTSEEEETSNCHQESHSYIPGLSIRTFWNAHEIEWCQKLESRYSVIRKEFLRAISNEEDLKREGNNIWASMVNQDSMSYGADWKTLVLMDKGIWDRTNCAFFPKTAQAIRDCGVPASEVFFTSMKPHSEIKMHSDGVNFLLTSHLPLVIPQNGKNKCRLTVGDDTKEWLNGKIMLFDTSIMHSAINDTDGMRYVLMMRVYHPHLTDQERQALEFTFDCLNVPELLSTNFEEQFMAEQQVAALHTLPDLSNKKLKQRHKSAKQKRKRSGGKGFGSR